MFRKLLHRPLAWLLLAALIVAALVPTTLLVHGKMLAAHAAGSNTPSITLSESTYHPTYASYKHPIIITGQGFNSGDDVAIYFDSTNNYAIAYGQCDSNGNFSVQANLPSSSVVEGVHSIIASDYQNGGGLSAMASITYLPALFDSVGRPGLPVHITGAAFNANETVQVYFGTKSGTPEGSTTTDSTGNLSFSFTAPAALQAGNYPVTIVRSNQKPAEVISRLTVYPVTMTSTPGIHSGQKVRVELTGFLPQETVTLSWNANGGQQLSWLYTGNNGAAKGSFTPPSAPPGSYTLTATGDTSGEQIANGLNIGPGISSRSSNPGSTITVNGGGFTANETVNVYFQVQKNGVVQTTTDATGSFSVSLTLPMTYNPSTAYFIHAVSADGSEHAETRFKFSTPSIYDGNGSYAYYTEPLSFFVFSFASDETIHLIWNYQQPGQFIIGTAVADSTGSASFYPTTPSTPDQSTVILAAVGVTSGLVVTTNLNNHPAIFMQPTTGKAGTKVTITGGSYGSSEPLTIMFGSASVANVTSNPDGTFTASFTAPKVTGAGNITVQVTGQTSGISLSLLFAYTPDMKVTPNVASFGDTVTVMGKHFAANSSITLSLPGNEYPGIMVGTDANGTFSASIPVTQQNFVRGTNDIGAFDVTTGATSSAVLMVQ